jgi:hypothetical protein
MCVIAYPNRMATSRTWRRSPEPVKALRNVEGMMFRMKSVVRYGIGVERCRVGVEARSGLKKVDDDQADDERDGGDHLEVDQGLGADASHLLHVTGAGDAKHHGAEDDWTDHHLDERDEPVAKGLQANGGVRLGVAEQSPGEDGDQHPEIEMSEKTCHAGRQCSAET